jgi:hypothetical protein
MPRARFRVAIAAAIVAASMGLGYVQTFPPGVPRWWGVLPYPVIFPAFMIGSRWPLIVALIPIGLIAAVSTLPVVFGSRRIRWWSVGSMLALLALAWTWLGLGFGFAMEYQAPGYAVFCAVAQACFTLSFVFIYIRNRRSPGFVTKAVFHGLACLWLASYAFPYMGELP